MSIQEWTQRTARALPFLGALGMAFWLAWFGVAYGSSVWVQPTEETTSVVSEMFIASTLSHAAVLLVAALAGHRLQRMVRTTPFILGSGLLATLGCLLVILAGPSFIHSRVLFLIGCSFTGLGTAAFSLNSALVLCTFKPQESLKALLVIEIVSILLQFMIYGLPQNVGVVVFSLMPLLSAGCFIIGKYRDVLFTFREINRLKPQRMFLVLLVAILILSVAANVSRGIYSNSIGPVQAASDGSINNLLTCVVFAIIFVFIYPRAQKFNFSHWFYVGAILIIAAFMCTYVFASQPEIAMCISSVSYSMFDLVTWYIFAYYVYQSKVSAITVFASGRAVIALGVTLGNLIGTLAPQLALGSIELQPIIFLMVFVASLSVFLILPEKRIDKLLMPIPDEDLDTQTRTPLPELAAADEGFSLDEIEDLAHHSAYSALEKVATSPHGIGAPAASSLEIPSETFSEITSNIGTSAVVATLVTEEPATEAKRPWKALMDAMALEYGLTDRESEVFVRLAKGRGSQSISDELVVSLYTTRAHTRSIYTKLDVHSRKELMDKATTYYESHLG